MKFLFIEEAQNLGGARIATINTASILQREGNEVLLYDIWGTCTPFVERCKTYNLKIEIVSQKKQPVVLTEGNLVKRLWKLTHFIFDIVKLNKLLREKIRRFNPDFICLSSRRVFYYLLLEPCGKVVYFQHEWGLLKQFTRINAYFLKQRTNSIICVSEATRQAIYNNGFKDLKSLYVYHTGVSMPKLTNTVERSERFTILHSAGFINLKGQTISIEIARKLKKMKLDFEMYLMGIIYNTEESRAYYRRLNCLVEEYGLNNNVKMIVSPNNVFDYVKASDVLIHPSQTEGYGMVVAEAQLLGKPVIANPVGGVIDLISNGYTGFLADFNNVDDYIRIITGLYNDKELYNRISRNAFEFVTTTITKERQKNQLIEIFNKIKNG